MSEKDKFDAVEDGDFVLFNNRKQPLEVVKKEEERAEIKGPQGGRYMIFVSERGLRVSKKGSRRYSSAVRDLRNTGTWERISDNEWEHTGTGARVEIVERGTGLWSIETEGFEPDVDVPQYGFTEREFAQETAKKIIRKHSEGK